MCLAIGLHKAAELGGRRQPATQFFIFTAHHSAYADPAADAVASAIPPKVDEAFKAFRYIPYSALTAAAKLHAVHGEVDFIVNAQGGLTAKGLDH